MDPAPARAVVRPRNPGRSRRSRASSSVANGVVYGEIDGPTGTECKPEAATGKILWSFATRRLGTGRPPPRSVARTPPPRPAHPSWGSGLLTARLVPRGTTPVLNNNKVYAVGMRYRIGRLARSRPRGGSGRVIYRPGSHPERDALEQAQLPLGRLAGAGCCPLPWPPLPDRCRRAPARLRQASTPSARRAPSGRVCYEAGQQA